MHMHNLAGPTRVHEGVSCAEACSSHMPMLDLKGLVQANDPALLKRCDALRP